MIAETSDDVLGQLIYPVGFWKVSATKVFLFAEGTTSRNLQP